MKSYYCLLKKCSDENSLMAFDFEVLALDVQTVHLDSSVAIGVRDFLQ